MEKRLCHAALAVITSYSIHYTKLYDLPKCANLKDNIGRKFLPENSLQLKIDQNFYITTVKERKVSIKLISEFIEKEFAYDAENSFHIDFAPRITSYNVCYTKLLRLTEFIKHSAQ